MILAGALFQEPSKKLTVVGITGTSGKTTTSYIVRYGYVVFGKGTR